MRPADTADRSRLHRRAQQALEENLGPGEPVLVIIRGRAKSAIIGTDRRAFVFKRGLVAGLGSNLASFDYRHITGVESHTGLFTQAPRVVLETAGAAPIRSKPGGRQNREVFRAPNVIPVMPGKKIEPEVARLRKLIAEAR